MSDDLSALRIRRNDLRSVLVHDCSNAEHCLCFGPEDVDHYELAEADYQAAVGARLRMALGSHFGGGR